MVHRVRLAAVDRRQASAGDANDARGAASAGREQLALPLSPAEQRAANDAPSGGAAPKQWTFLCLAEILNFVDLRRLLGRARAHQLCDDLATVIRAELPEARLTWAARRRIEFAFESDQQGALGEALERLQAAFDQPLVLDAEPHRVELAFAAAAAPSLAADDIRMTEQTESAILEARAERRIVVRDLSRGGAAFDKLTMMRELGPAIAAGEMFLQYQPKLHLRRHEIAGAEALVRWQHRTRGLVQPGDFITVAEESRDIGGLTLWTLRQVIADQKLIAASGRDMPVFVNISGQLLSDPVFVEQVCGMIRDNGGKIGLEITETSVIRDPETAIRHLNAFHSIGIPVAIDDYGAGLSSLAYLKQLPASELKIDKMFVLQLTSSSRDPLIVRSTIDLAHAMEMEVTAEGVESQAALALLSVMGCDMAQGFLISRPLAIEGFRQFVENERHLFHGFDPRASFARGEAFFRGR